MVDIQLDEIIRLLASNVAQLMHVYFVSLTSQRLIDYSNELQNVVYAFCLPIMFELSLHQTNNIKLGKRCGK